MSTQDKPVTADDLHMATMDRIYMTRPRAFRFPMRDALVAAADKNGSHKMAYKIHGAARRIKS
jgi:6-phosphogluconolactonase (cycloisomerase 2 family)